MPAAGAAAAPPQPASTTTVPAPIVQGDTLAAPAVSQGSGGTSVKSSKPKAEKPTPASPAAPDSAGAVAVPSPSQTFSIPAIPSSTCAAAGVPPILIPIYQRASAAYNLGPQGPAVLAGINEIETAFGTNLNVSSAGAEGWMQFMPSTWATYGVDANGDGVRDPYNPEDAIFAAARYLSAAGMPADTYGAIYAYNHADWYVAEVLANANCYAPSVGGSAVGGVSLTPKLQVLTCRPGRGAGAQSPGRLPERLRERRRPLRPRPPRGLGAGGDRAAGVELRQGHDASASCGAAGPLGLDPIEWRHYAVDGDGDGRIRHADPADSAATLARLIWSRAASAPASSPTTRPSGTCRP